MLARRIRLVLGLTLSAFAAVMAALALSGGSIYRAWVLAANPEFAEPFATGGIVTMVAAFRVLAGVGAAACLAVALAGLRKKPSSLGLLRKGYIAAWALSAAYAFVAIEGVNLIADKGLRVGGENLDPVDIFYLKASLVWPAALAIALFAGLFVLSRQWWVAMLYGGHAASPKDRRVVIGGRDPVFRRGLSISLAVHFLVIIILPWVLQGGGCVLQYKMPGGGGGGGQVQEVAVKILKAKQKSKRKTYTLRANSAISFYVPTIDEATVMKEVDQETEHVYQASKTGLGEGKGKGFGKGKGGHGGWAGGDDHGVLRFVRIQHGGRGWDDGMDEKTRADLNFMDALRTTTGLRVADKSEAYPIYMFKQFNPRNPCPLAYMTGEGDIPNVSPGDVKVLRQYCLDGGMVFGDAGSPEFVQSFKFLMSHVFPDKAMVDVSNDDPLFQMPFVFPNGAPPLWHHGGNRPMGIKHDGRWIVFLFPGDMNDAWKTGHSGAAEDVATQALHLGMNIVYYAYTNYAETHYAQP